jgi:hypothetical protein
VSEFFQSLKADLTDRRLLPLVAVVAVGLVAALAYALMGGSSSHEASPPAASSSAAVPGGLAVNATTSERAVAETTDGFREQRKGSARNPFQELPGATTTQSSSKTATSSPSSSSSSPSSSGSGSTPSSETPSSKTETKSQPKKSKPKTVYNVAIQFGVFPPGATPETVVLTPYENLKLQTVLPSTKNPLIVFRGVTVGGKSATFTIVGETIMHGTGACLPTPANCQALDLKPGQTEQLEYLPPSGGQMVVYELRVVSIEGTKAKASAAKRGGVWKASRAGMALLRRSGLVELPFLRYSSLPGVLVFSAPRAGAARAHAAVRFHLPHGW